MSICIDFPRFSSFRKKKTSESLGNFTDFKEPPENWAQLDQQDQSSVSWLELWFCFCTHREQYFC